MIITNKQRTPLTTTPRHIGSHSHGSHSFIPYAIAYGINEFLKRLARACTVGYLLLDGVACVKEADS